MIHIVLMICFFRKIVLLLVGLDNAGKTTALKGLAGGMHIYRMWDMHGVS
jgi:GTPase SAR1 family protein